MPCYQLCGMFSPELYFAEGEPYDRGEPLTEEERARPKSVWQAIEILAEDSERWDALARDVFHIEGRFLTPESVLDKIQETDTAESIGNPVRLRIDPQGDYTIEVY
jgi:hypothetical protein